MNGVHDLGGTDGLGPVPVPDSEPVFRADWEKAAFAMFSMAFRAGFFGVDAFRYGIEQMHPAVYLLSPYYEHWVHAVEHYGFAKGELDETELDKRTQYYLENPDAPLPERDDPEFDAIVQAFIHHGIPAPPEPVQRTARFAVADAVETTVVEHPAPGREHTRIPGYAQGKTGVVERVFAPQSLPDAVVAGRGELPEHVYAVRFRARDLWPDAGARDSVCVDLWESYLRPAGAGPAATGEAS
jgi:nitrile hydratase